MPGAEVFHQAVLLHQQGRLEDAARLYLGMLGASDAADFEVRYMLGCLRYQQGRNGEALQMVETALGLDPTAAKVLLLHGILLQGAGRPLEALSQFAAAAAREPGNGEVWHNRGVVEAALGRHAEAVASFDKALAIRPTAQGWNDRGAALESLKQYAMALRSFDAALSLKPDFAHAWSNRASVLQDMGRFDEALAACDKALALAPDSAATWTVRGSVLVKLGRFADALESYDKATAHAPHLALGWSNRGTALQGLKRYDEAIASYDKALALSPRYVPALTKRAVALQSAHRLDEGLAGADAALTVEPENPEALFARGRILCELGRVAEAHHAFRLRAENLYASVPFSRPDDAAAKQRHDQEQRAYLAQTGVTAEGGIYFAGGERLAGRAINPHNGPIADAAWAQKRPPIVVIDDLLTPEAMAALQQFCRGSTVWRWTYPNGYLGAMSESGFACPLLAQIAEELRATFPGIFAEHMLRMMWGFKYDSRHKGIPIHADQAAVNVNFWITPDEANRNPASGGLVIWDSCAPMEWDFQRYNGDVEAARAFLASVNSKPVTVPYHANRAVIFDSDLFHETDTIEFEEGYLNRRINITMLYGRRASDGS